MPLLRARRFAALLLAAGLALVLASGLAACAGASDNAPASAPTGSAPPTAAPAEPAAPVEPTATATPTAPAETVQTPIVTPEPPAPLAEPSPAPAPAPEPPAAPDSSTSPAEPTETSTTPFLYDTYDLSGTVAEPGHYAFLADPDDPASVVTTYEGLRDGTATALLIHTTDAHGVPQTERYDAVATGDLFEWRQASDCFVRYTVTDAPAPAAGATVRSFGVAWMTYAFTGCRGTIAVTSADFRWGPLPDLGGTSLTAPIRHGPFQIVPEGWTGATEEPTGHAPPGWNLNNSRYTENVAEARRYPYWREPALPSGWTFAQASTDPTETIYGYRAVYLTPRGGLGLVVEGDHATFRGYLRDAAWRTNGGNHLSVTETRVIAGRPAQVLYSPAGPDHEPLAPVIVRIYNPATESRHTVFGRTKSLRGANVDAVIAIARSLFAPPNAP